MNKQIDIDKNKEEPLYRQLYNSIIAKIENGILQPGELLPGSRELAQSLQVSRITVVRAYDQLLSEGFIDAAVGSGTFVSRKLKPVRSESLAVPQAINLSHLSNFGQWLTKDRHPQTDDTNIFLPQSDLLPHQQWRQTLLRHYRTDGRQSLNFSQEVFGYRPLQEAICAYLKRTKGIHCRPNQIAIFSGTHQSFNLLTKVFLNENDVAVVENPGSSQTRKALLGQNASLRLISVDEHGARIDDLQSIAEPVKMLCITPSHQNPTGAMLSLPRRDALLQWSSAHKDSIIVEQDYNGHLCYGSATQSLQGMTDSSSFFYLSNFNQLLHPLTSIAFAVIPLGYVSVFERAKSLMERDVSLTEQCILADFINDGHLEKFTRTIRAFYAKRRQSLIFALTKAFKHRIKIGKENGGLHLFIKFFAQLTENEISACAAEAGLHLVSAKACYHNDDSDDGVFLAPFIDIEAENVTMAVNAFADRIRELESERCLFAMAQLESQRHLVTPLSSLGTKSSSDEQYLMGVPAAQAAISAG